MLPFIPPSVSGQTDEGKCQPPEEREGRRGEETEEKTGVERAGPPCVSVSFSPDCTLSQFYPSLLAPLHLMRVFMLRFYSGPMKDFVLPPSPPVITDSLQPLMVHSHLSFLQLYTLFYFLHALYSKVWSTTVPKRCSQDQRPHQPSLTRNDSSPVERTWHGIHSSLAQTGRTKLLLMWLSK